MNESVLNDVIKKVWDSVAETKATKSLSDNYTFDLKKAFNNDV